MANNVLYMDFSDQKISKLEQVENRIESIREDCEWYGLKTWQEVLTGITLAIPMSLVLYSVASLNFWFIFAAITSSVTLTMIADRKLKIFEIDELLDYVEKEGLIVNEDERVAA